ncbi:fibronectin type III domain-containing protein 7 isoform X5 [Chiroxiphia lanceolata]|uniref:fibronectin type III domain-containing protein 7 isoform X5 n=1 Tax=Chiroxiphia lanceolata TaxID=296741 RepID=UPI0013CE7409|nr:fibronectin type III domain-containing protein 7 isoform X5 [Chiroxiphia lanceolata]
MCGAKSKSLAFTGLLLNCLELIFSANTGLSVSIYDVTSQSISLRWPKFSGASSYRVTATAVNTVGHSLLAHFSDVTFKTTLTSLIPNTVYAIQAEAIDKNGIILAETQITQSTAPDIPVIDQAYSKLSNSITVEWRAVPGATGYVLTAQDGDSFIETVVKNSPGTVTGLKPATLYRITIRSINSGGKSQPSPFRKAKTVLAAPILSVSSPNCDSIALSWKAVYMAAGFSVSLMRSDGLGRMLRENTTNTSLIFTNLDPGTLYTIKAYAWNANGMPGDDFTYNQRTSPNAPADVKVAFNSGALRVSWMPTEGALTYSVTASNGLLKLKCNTSSSSCMVPSLQCSSEYYVSVTAYNDAGSSKPTDAVSLKTIPCAPVNISIEEDEPGHLLVSWSSVSFGHYYVVFVKSDDGLEVHCNTSYTQCHFQSDCGFTYFISVFAYNKAGQSPLGDVFNYTTAPCCPSDFRAVFVSSDTVRVTWAPVRGADLYETRAAAWSTVVLCNDTAPTCTLSALQCNTRYHITVHSFSEARGSNTSCAPKHVATAPCCPNDLILTQVTQSVTNISWSAGKGAQTYVTTLESPKGQAKCGTLQNYCLLGCITCGTNYTVSLKAISETGLTSSCTYQGYSSSACCPSGVKLYRLSNNGIRVFWRASDETINYSTDLRGSKGNFTCTPSTGQSHCDITEIPCGDVYTVVVAPLTDKDLKLTFCPKKIYSVTCSGSSVGMVIYRGKSNAEHI